jgi:hypothetical protein
MSGGTTFHFVTDGIDNALARAAEASEGKDIRLGGLSQQSENTFMPDSSMRCT